MAASTATFAVGRSQPSCAATGAYMSSSAAARARAGSPETAASTRGSTWPRSARTSTCPGSARTAGRSSAGRLCSPADAVMRPDAPSAACHWPRSRPSAPTWRSHHAQPYVVAVRSALRQASSAATAGEVAACGSSRHERVSGRSRPIRASPCLTWPVLRRSTGRWARTSASRAVRCAASAAASAGRGPITSVSSAAATSRSSGSPRCSSSTDSRAAEDSAHAVSTASGGPWLAGRGSARAVSAATCCCWSDRATTAQAAAVSRSSNHLPRNHSRLSWPSAHTGPTASSRSNRSLWTPRSGAGSGSPCAAAHTAAGSSRRRPCSSRPTAPRSQQARRCTPPRTRAVAVDRADHQVHRGCSGRTERTVATGSPATARLPPGQASATPSGTTTSTSGALGTTPASASSPASSSVEDTGPLSSPRPRAPPLGSRAWQSVRAALWPRASETVRPPRRRPVVTWSCCGCPRPGPTCRCCAPRRRAWPPASTSPSTTSRTCASRSTRPARCCCTRRWPGPTWSAASS